MKWAWVGVTTDIDPPLTPQSVVDHDEDQHKDSKELGKSLTSSGDEVVVPYNSSVGTPFLSPMTSSGISEGHRL